MKKRVCLIGLAILVLIFSLAGSGMATFFPSSAFVDSDANYYGWHPPTLTGTAKYEFFWDYNANVNVLTLDFKSDIFNVDPNSNGMNKNDFTLVLPSSWQYSTAWVPLSGKTTFMLNLTPGVSSTQDPIALLVNYKLQTENWKWNWVQQYSLFDGGAAVSTGTTTAVPEPATLILLGSGLVGLVAFRKKFKK